MKKFISEFKEFIAKGDVMSMAVGIIIGGAFTSIVNSLVGDVITHSDANQNLILSLSKKRRLNRLKTSNC